MTTTAPVAGWYPDPLGSTDLRYWDGSGWTERTAAAAALAAPEPVTAPQVPVQPMATQPLPQQAMPFQAMAPQPAWPGAPVTGAPQPYGYPPGGPMQQRPPGFAHRRPPGRSTAATVLIGLAIAVGVLFVVGILAAVAIPVFLNQRAATHPTSGSSPTRRTGTTTVVIPQNAAGLTLSQSASSRPVLQRLQAIPLPGDKSAGVYDDASGRLRAAILVTRVDWNTVDQAAFFRGAEVGAGRSLTDVHDVAPGPLGGHVRCGSLRTADVSVCFFVDGHAGGVMDLFGGTDGDALAVQLRQAVELRS